MIKLKNDFGNTSDSNKYAVKYSLQSLKEFMIL